MATPIPSGTEQLLLFLFVIFVTTKMLGEIFERLKLPAVPGEILAGVALGPYALGWIPPSDTLRSVAQIGAIFVLFSAGLETSPRDLIRVSRKALLVSVAGVVVPFVLGFAYMKLRGDTTVEAVFIAAAMVATSIGITARALADMNVLSTRTARIILGAAVFDDVLGMLVLAVVAGAESGKGVQWWHLGVLIAEAVTFALFMMFVAPRLVHQLHPRLEQLSTQNASLVVALAICLLLSWLAAKIGMAAIVGAFFAGLMFADYAPRWNLISRVGGITAFLARLFFFDIGSLAEYAAAHGKLADHGNCHLSAGDHLEGDRLRAAASARRLADGVSRPCSTLRTFASKVMFLFAKLGERARKRLTRLRVKWRPPRPRI